MQKRVPLELAGPRLLVRMSQQQELYKNFLVKKMPAFIGGDNRSPYLGKESAIDLNFFERHGHEGCRQGICFCCPRMGNPDSQVLVGWLRTSRVDDMRAFDLASRPAQGAAVEEKARRSLIGKKASPSADGPSPLTRIQIGRIAAGQNRARPGMEEKPVDLPGGKNFCRLVQSIAFANPAQVEIELCGRGLKARLMFYHRHAKPLI